MSSYMGSSAAQADFAAFEEKVKRTVYLDNLSPKVTESVLKMALNQFGTVKSVQFIPNYMEPRNIPQCALVEMENSRQAGAVVSEISQFPFMMSGMPRPVRARPAEVEMFDGHPIKPGRRIQCRWLEASDPDFKIATEIKRLTWKHAAEVAFLLKVSLGSLMLSFVFGSGYYMFLSEVNHGSISFMNYMNFSLVATTTGRREACKAAAR